MSLAYEQIVAHRFDQLADRFKDSIPPDDYRLSALRSALGPLAGLLLLDLGCGKGRFATALERMGAKVVGLDRSRGMLACSDLGSRVHASALRLPFPDNEFDAVYAIEVLQHLPSARLTACISEAARVLRPGGRFVVIDRNLWALDDRRPWLPSVALKRLDEYRGRWMYQAGGPVRERWNSPSGLQRILKKRLINHHVQMLIRPEESHRWLFERIPLARRMALWTGEKPGGGHG
jgi:2-polyprenyl-6-hydroxyphenyl methylase/3-demethylubiquinone-9 3-methyltransferase